MNENYLMNRYSTVDECICYLLDSFYTFLSIQKLLTQVNFRQDVELIAAKDVTDVRPRESISSEELVS